MPRPKFIFVSPWLLAAATGLLVLIVVTFALNNMQREKRLMTGAMVQKAATLIRVIHSGARSSYFSDLRRGMWNSFPWNEHVQRVIDHLSEDPDIRFLAIVDNQGTIIAHNNRDAIGRHQEFFKPSGQQVDQQKNSPLVFQIRSTKEDGRIFEAVRDFHPFLPPIPPRHLRSLKGMGRNFFTRENDQLSQHLRYHFFNKQEKRAGGKYFVVVGLDMQAYDRALARLRFQILMLSLAMLLVGVGGWLSLAAVQGYRVSQQTLDEIQAFTGLLVAHLPVGIIATDKKGLIANFNQAATKITGIATRQATGKSPESLLPPELALFFKSPVVENHDAAIENSEREQEVRVSINGQGFVLICHQITIRDRENNYMGQVLLLSDVSQLKSLEQKMREHERLAAVGRMAAGVAHEVRNPLSSVKGLALLLKEKFAGNTKENETATLLIREVERMNRTISELLSFARPAPLDLRQVDLGRLLSKEVQLIEADAATDGISINLEVPDDLLPVAADKDRLNQVFINILLNAVQSMEGGGTLSVTACNNVRDSTVKVTIIDSGRGMDKETLSQVFYPYFTTRQQGTGIGLAISQKIISDHGGTISLESRLGRGTTVVIELPVFTAAA